MNRREKEALELFIDALAEARLALTPEQQQLALAKAEERRHEYNRLMVSPEFDDLF